MEVGYSQVEREEQLSAQIGLREDMEDMKQEEEDRKKKVLRMKNMKQSSLKGRR